MLNEYTFEKCKEALKDCDHPEDKLVQITEYMDGFYWYCKKCHTSFSRYDLQPIREYQKMIAGGINAEPEELLTTGYQSVTEGGTQ